MAAKTPDNLKELETYLLKNGFSGDIPQNSGHKNWLVIKKLMKNEQFYTFGIKRIEQAVKKHEVDAKKIRKIMVADAGISIDRFRRHGPGHFDSAMVTDRVIQAMEEISRRAAEGETMAFASGHPGAMIGLLDGLAVWAGKLGAKLVTIDHAITVDDRFKLDMLGHVLVASDNCSAMHTHEDRYMNSLLLERRVDFVVGDHGFVGSALNHNIPSIGFYDTDDPGMPLAAALDLPVLPVPINDNCYNADGASLAAYLVERFGNATHKPRRSRITTH